MKVVILQSNYVPWKGYFDLINEADKFIFYDIVKYTKNDWRNRNIIYTKNGKQWLTIPIESTAVKLNINEVEIKNHAWQELHLKSLYNGYKKAPFFEQLEEIMVDYLQNNKWNTLSELNKYIIINISNRLGITTEFVNAEDFEVDGNRLERLLALLKKVGATKYISGPSAKNYLLGKETFFNDLGIEFSYKDYGNYPEYKQLSVPFEQGVSILDLVANISWDDIPHFIWKRKNI